MKDGDLRKLRKILERCWTSETSYYDEREYQVRAEEGIRSFGQCYVTAKALEEIFGWRVVENRKVKHFWNMLPYGSEVDFTSDQFGGDGTRPIMTTEDPRERFAEYLGTPKRPARGRERSRIFLDCVQDSLESLGLKWGGEPFPKSAWRGQKDENC
ncbi:MAG: hypothetical protein ACE5KV_07180 [Thermoplasmata archaeon]